MGLKLGIEDPEQWLEDCPDRVFDLWESYSQLEPWWGERELLAKILSCLRHLVADNTEKDGIAERLQSLDRDASQFMPADWYGQPDAVDSEQAILQVQRQLEAGL